MQREAAWIRGAMSGETPSLSAALRARVEELDPVTLAGLALAHQAGPWLLAALADGDQALPPSSELLRRVASEQVALTLAHQGELPRILRELERKQVEVVVLKGPGLARVSYPQEGLRPYRDLDLLVRERDAATAIELLAQAAYTEQHEEPRRRLHREHALSQRVFEHSGRRLRVEVHCDHLQIGVEPVGMDAIWERSERIDFGGVAARILEPHDLFVHLCVHLHGHSFSRLIWFKDLDLLVRDGGLDWALVRQRATEQGCVDSVALSLDLLEAMLATRLPAEARALVASRPSWSRWLQRFVWPRRRILDLEPQRHWRLRRLVQFAPESGLVRGGLPSLLFTGRRRAKLRVLAAALPGRGRRRPSREHDAGQQAGSGRYT